MARQIQTKRKNNFQSAVLVLLASFLILGIIVKLNPQPAVDLAITLFIQQFNSGWFDFLMRSVTFLGNPILFITTITIAGVFIFWRSGKKESLLLVISSAGAYFISVLVKAVVERPRPDPNIIHQIGNFLNSDSFPSGHVLVFIGFYGFLLYLIYTRMKKSWLKLVLIKICLLLLILIGLSRIYLGAHWFSDVLGSYLIGGVWIYCLTKIDHKFISFGKK